METPPLLRAVNDAKKNLNGFMSRFQGAASNSAAKNSNAATTQAPASASNATSAAARSPLANAATPQKLNFSQPAAALTPP